MELLAKLDEYPSFVRMAVNVALRSTKRGDLERMSKDVDQLIINIRDKNRDGINAFYDVYHIGNDSIIKLLISRLVGDDE